MSDTPTLYHNPRCSKSRATLALLRDQGVECQTVEYLKTPPDAKILRSIIDKLGVSPHDLLRTTEAEYRALGLKDAELDAEALIRTMVGRPILIQGDRARTGRPPEQVLEVLS